MKKYLPVLWTIGALCGIAALVAWFAIFKTADPVTVVTEKVFERFERDLDLSVPAAEEASNENRQLGVIIINIREEGEIVLNNMVVSKENLGDRLASISAEFPGQAVILRGDADADFGQIIQILDVIKKAGIWNVAFATTQPEA